MITKKFKNQIVKTSFHINRFRGYHPKIWLIGDGRSGTTWVSGLINYEHKFREVFEPFHPDYLQQMAFLITHLYKRPNEPDSHLEQVVEQVFNGHLWHPRTDQDNKIGLYQGLFVKDIFANLFANWVYQRFQEIKIVFLIRNPFAVAASKRTNKHWNWVTDPMTLYNQISLREDYLIPHHDLIHRVAKEGNFLQQQLLIWSIIHHVPFKQFQTGQIHLAFYENIYQNPQDEMAKLYDFIEQPFSSLPTEVIHRPSRVVGKNITQNQSPITSWKNDFTAQEIDDGMEILAAFGLESLYDENAQPTPLDLNRF